MADEGSDRTDRIAVEVVRPSSRERCDVLDGDPHHLPMAARTNRTGEWCSPTREIPRPRLIRLIDESRGGEAVVEKVHDVPARKCPATALELLERTRCNSMLIDLRSLGDPDEECAPDLDPLPLLSEPEEEEATVTLMYAPMTKDAMPPTAEPTQNVAFRARRGRRIAAVRLVLCLGALVFLCLRVLALLGLGIWGVSDAGIDVSAGL
jgi:hypothetical protein